jgi:hypothetical protein
VSGGRWRWVAAGAALLASAGLLVASGAPAGAEAWADRRAAGCQSVARPHPRASAPARPQAPADYRAGTLRAAECQAWLRLHGHGPLGRPSVPAGRPGAPVSRPAAH